MSKFFTVATTGSDREVRAYLYGHTTVVRTVVDSRSGRRHVLLKTTDSIHGSDTSETHLARGQADRFASGLHGVSVIFDTEREAVDKHFATWGVNLGGVEVAKTISELRTEVCAAVEEQVVKASRTRSTHPERLNVRLDETRQALGVRDAEKAYFALVGAVTACGHYDTTQYLLNAAHLLLGFFEVQAEADNASRRAAADACARRSR